MDWADVEMRLSKSFDEERRRIWGSQGSNSRRGNYDEEDENEEEEEESLGDVEGHSRSDVLDVISSEKLKEFMSGSGLEPPSIEQDTDSEIPRLHRLYFVLDSMSLADDGSDGEGAEKDDGIEPEGNFVQLVFQRKPPVDSDDTSDLPFPLMECPPVIDLSSILQLLFVPFFLSFLLKRKTLI